MYVEGTPLPSPDHCKVSEMFANMQTARKETMLVYTYSSMAQITYQLPSIVPRSVLDVKPAVMSKYTTFPLNKRGTYMKERPFDEFKLRVNVRKRQERCMRRLLTLMDMENVLAPVAKKRSAGRDASMSEYKH